MENPLLAKTDSKGVALAAEHRSISESITIILLHCSLSYLEFLKSGYRIQQ